MLEHLKGNFEEDENGIGLSLGLSIGGNYTKKIDQVCNSDDKMLIERQRSQKRAMHREMMENEEIMSKQTVLRKREIGTIGNECCTYDDNQNLAVHKKNALRGKEYCRGFRLYNENRGGINMSYNQCGSSESEENLSGKSLSNGSMERCFKNYKALSNGSTERCSSTISECQSLYPKGRSSSDNAQGYQDAQFELLTSSNVMPIKEEQDQITEEKRRTKSSPMKQQSEKSEIKNCDMIQLLSRMPCVSATGTGPNGKTIKGLLCKYNSKTEINIVCVCHGKSFTPSEFVEHAGGVDVSQPLRHIIVIPPCF